MLPVGSTASVLSIADASAPEKQGSIPVAVTLTPTGAAPVTVQYATADGTGSKGAFAGTDYTAKSGTLTFSPGQSTQTITIAITPYSGVQPNKSFQVVLSNPVGATLANSTATLTILNDNARVTLPPINPEGRLEATRPSVPIPVPRTNTDHPVLVQMLTGQSRVNAKGQATYRISCPDVVIPAVRRHRHLRRPGPGGSEEGLQEEADADQRARGQRHVQPAYREDGQRRDHDDEAGHGAPQGRQAPEGEGDDQREGRCRGRRASRHGSSRSSAAADREEADGQEADEPRRNSLGQRTFTANA